VLLTQWERVARTLDAQGEIELAGDVRYYAKYLPPVMTDRKRVASDFIALSRSGVTKSSVIRDQSAFEIAARRP
jgi:hypothetical protein